MILDVFRSQRGLEVTHSLALRLALCMALVSASFAWSAPVQAQLDSVRSSAAARALFREGVECADRADWTCAVDRHGRAYGLRPSPVIAYNLGMALLAVGRLVEGTEMLVRVSRDEHATAELRAEARTAADHARPRIGRLTVHVEGPLAGATLSLDGHDVRRELLDTASPADPREHVLIVHRDGSEVARGTVILADGQLAELSVTIPPLPAADVALADEPDADVLALAPPAPASDDAPWIALGIGGAVLVVGGAIVLGVVLAQPGSSAPFEGTLGHVEFGR